MTTVTKPNRVFFISREFNFIRDEFKVDATNAAQKATLFFNGLIKALSAGFGPYPITSVKIVDKKAVVDIGQPCYLQPGVKINLEGTSVPLIDTWHEIQEVDGNTYTVYIDTPDGEYTNGITMGYPSLGWTLIERDANRYLFKSGPSASMGHQILFTYNPDKPANVETWRNIFTLKKVKSEGTLSTIVDEQPLSSYAETGMCLYFDDTPSRLNPTTWLYYGDDAFVHMGYRCFDAQIGSRWRNMFSLNYLTFGELARGPYRSGYFMINGPWGGNTAGTTVKSFYYTNIYQPYSCYYTGFVYGNNTNNTLVIGNVNEKTGYGVYADIFANMNTRAGSSGRLYTTQASYRYVTENMYSSPSIQLYDEDIFAGQIPGIYFLYKQPNMTQPYSVPTSLIPIKASGKLKGRHVHAVWGGDVNSTELQYNGNGGSDIINFNQAYATVHLLDLTGPIR